MKKAMIGLIGVLLLVTVLSAAPINVAEMSITPNPFDTVTTISCLVPEAGNINLVISDRHGNVVKTLFTGYLPKGNYDFTWDGTNEQNSRLPVGSYEVELSTGAKFTSLKKIIILK